MLDQRLRRWPTLKQHSVSVPCRLGKLLLSYAGGQLFPGTHGNIAFCVQHRAHMREMVNYFPIDVAQVYRVYMTWELALNAAMGMKRIYYYYLGW